MSGPGKRAEGRSVTIVVCDDRGSLLGSLGPFEVATPWWQDLEPVRCRGPSRAPQDDPLRTGKRPPRIGYGM